LVSGTGRGFESPPLRKHKRWAQSISSSMRHFTILALFLLSSCKHHADRTTLFSSLYGQRFSVNDSLTIEFIDSTNYITLGGKADLDLIAVSKWWIEQSENETTLNYNWNNIDSGRLTLATLDFNIIKFKNLTKDVLFSKLEKIEVPEIVGRWICINCSSTPPFTTMNDSLNPTYVFTADNISKIQDFDLSGVRKWRVTQSGQLIILYDINVPNYIDVENILVVKKNESNSLILSRVDDHAELITRILEPARN
jgi:hypothetical protein